MKISLIQPNFQQGPKEFNAYYLPYTIGILWSYVRQFPKIRDNYVLENIIWRRSDIDEVVEKIKNSDVFAFSTYVWNKNYNYTLAKRIKQINPNSIIIFGGPELPITKKDIFQKLPFIDVVAKGEGEITFKHILEHIVDNKEFTDIEGIVLNDGGIAVNIGKTLRIDNLDEIPSPYLSGVFDSLMVDTPEIEWNATIETNRGCPYQCTFCDWGSLTYNKVKKFDLNRVYDEIDWIGKNKCGYATITDANFGMFVDRDGAIADKLVAVQTEYGYPNAFSMTWAKNQRAEVFDIIYKLIKNPHFNQGLTVSVQSMSPTVLKDIKRHNLGQHQIEDIFLRCDKNNIPVYTEVILALPSETKESWKAGVWKIIEAGNHTGINFLHAQLLENAEMNLLQRALNKITTVFVSDYMSGSYNLDDLQETVEIVTSTSTMSSDDILDCQVFNWYVNTFHVGGLTTYISRFLYKKYNIQYADFYEKFFNFLQQSEWFQKEKNTVRNYYVNWMTNGKIAHPGFGSVEIHGWNLIHTTSMTILLDKKHEYVFDLISSFVKSEYKFDPEIIEELIQFQKLCVIDYFNLANYPIIKSFGYNFLEYILSNAQLEQETTYQFLFNESADISLERYLENLYFNRKRNFGKAVITKE